MDVRDDLVPTGSLRAAINLGNPVLAQGTPESPGGVTVDIARELGRRLDVPVDLHCFGAARESFEALRDGVVDLCFLAIEPVREQEVAFTSPYVIIEGVYVVPDGSPLTSPADVDRSGVRIGVSEGSAYDLFLSRTLTQAELVRGDDGVVAFSEQHLEAAAGVRQPMEGFVASTPGVRVVEPRFMEIQQAVGTSRDRDPETVAFLRTFVEELKAGGFVADALRRSGQDATVAPPAG